MKEQVKEEDAEDEEATSAKREFELYEAHILQNIGVEAGDAKRPRKNSQDNSGYNSKDSDFSNNYEGSEHQDDFGGNHSRSDSNSQYHDDDF